MKIDLFLKYKIISITLKLVLAILSKSITNEMITQFESNILS